MKLGFSRLVLGVVVLLGAGWLGGCAKRIPLEGGAFEANQKVVLTMKDGRTLRGHIAPDERVEYRDQDKIYRGRVIEVTDEIIRVGDLVLVEGINSYDTTLRRMKDSRLRLAPAGEPITLSRDEVAKVEQVVLDTGRTLRKTVFWTYGGTLLVVLLGERS